MRCVICKKGLVGPDRVPTLFRINAKGVPGLWVCARHRKQTDAPEPDPVVREIVEAIGGKP